MTKAEEMASLANSAVEARISLKKRTEEAFDRKIKDAYAAGVKEAEENEDTYLRVIEDQASAGYFSLSIGIGRNFKGRGEDPEKTSFLRGKLDKAQLLMVHHGFKTELRTEDLGSVGDENSDVDELEKTMLCISWLPGGKLV